jgi:hypothetical protein
MTKIVATEEVKKRHLPELKSFTFINWYEGV